MSRQCQQMTIDWYSWLSKTNLKPTHVYDYSLAFVQNELQEEDLMYFNHDFLQSMGLFIPEHRVEILKLARNEVSGRLKGFSRLVLAMNKTKKLFAKNIGKLSFHKSSSQVRVSEIAPNGNQLNGVKRNQQEKTMVISRNTMRSGPLDTKRVQEKLMLTSRSISVSGPLDGRVTYPNWSPMVTRPMEGAQKDKLGFLCRSPTISEPARRWALSPNESYYRSGELGDDGGPQSLWSMMFQDIKPT